MHKVFVSFHHANDQKYKEGLVSWAEKNKVFIDGSVDMGEIPEDWDDQKIREYIRDEHLKDTTVTILLVGTETKNRKHIDWELYSSMYDGTVNKKSGIIVILLPSVKSEYYTCAHSSEKTFYPETTDSLLQEKSDTLCVARYIKCVKLFFKGYTNRLEIADNDITIHSFKVVFGS